MPSGIELRAYEEADFEPFIQNVDSGFGNDTVKERLEQEGRIFEADRAFVATDGGQVIGTTAAQSLPLTVPGGGVVANGGIVYVAVKPSHRRRGILTTMMSRQLEQAHERGDPVASLWASEASIYGRFGFGMAVPREEWSIPRDRAQMTGTPDSDGDVVMLKPDEARPHLERVYETVRPVWAGMLERRSNWWDFLLADPKHEWAGHGPRRHVVYLEDGEPRGYVTYGVELETRTLDILELMWASEAAHWALWRYCLSVDRISTIRAWNQPPDDPLPWMMYDYRRLRREPQDGLWVRLVDVAGALSARKYSGARRLVIRVRDEFCSWNDGTYELEAEPDGAKCESTSADADIELGVEELGAVYMGGVSFSTLAAARRVEELRPGAVFEADRMFAGERAPWCPQEF